MIDIGSAFTSIYMPNTSLSILIVIDDLKYVCTHKIQPIESPLMAKLNPKYVNSIDT